MLSRGRRLGDPGSLPHLARNGGAGARASWESQVRPAGCASRSSVPATCATLRNRARSYSCCWPTVGGRWSSERWRGEERASGTRPCSVLGADPVTCRRHRRGPPCQPTSVLNWNHTTCLATNRLVPASSVSAGSRKSCKIRPAGVALARPGGPGFGLWKG